MDHHFGRFSRENTSETFMSMDWFKGKFTGNHGILPLNMGFSCKFSRKPIHCLWQIGGWECSLATGQTSPEMFWKKS